MTGETKPGLLQRIEANARKATPLWQWLIWIVPIFLPLPLGYGYAALAEHTAGRLPGGSYLIITYAQWAGCMCLVVLMIIDTWIGYSRRFFRQPDWRELPPGPFRLGAGLLGVFYRWWWGLLALIVFINMLPRMIDAYGLGRFAHEIFWNGMALFGLFFATVLSFFGVVSLAGMFIRQRLREPDRSA